MMRKLTVVAGLTLALLAAACGPTEPPASPTPTPAPPPAPTAAPAPPVAPGPGPDQCGARALQSLVGKPRSEIPIPTNPAKRRVACTTCPVTMDYAPDRLNIFFDAGTGVIKEVKCG